MSADVAAAVVTDLRRASLTRGAADEAEISRIDRQTREQFDTQSTPTTPPPASGMTASSSRRRPATCSACAWRLAAQEIALPPNRPVYRM